MYLPTNCQYEITERCNHECFFCYNPFLKKNSGEDSDWKRIAEKISKTGVFDVAITGGEPFVVKERLLGVAKIFYDKNIDFSINSNLTLF